MRFNFENIVGRRFILVLMTALLALGMVACGDNDKDGDKENNHSNHVQEDAGNDTGVKPDAAVENDAAVESDAAVETDVPVDTDGKDDTDAEVIPTPLEVEGTWVTEFGDEEITATQWGFSPLVKYDNAKRVAFTLNAADAAYNPGKYGKIVWTPIVDNSFYYCTVEFALDTLADAENSTTPFDATNPDEEGCGTFAWSKLTRK